MKHPEPPPKTFQSIVRQGLADWLSNPHAVAPGQTVAIQEVRLDDGQILVVFTTPERPGCRLGFRFPAQPPSEDPELDAAFWTTIAATNFMEAVLFALPDDCAPGEIAWLDWSG
jgi:hypothetical protein